ncbi:MAG: methyltransferase [Pseudomonadota bacterium]
MVSFTDPAQPRIGLFERARGAANRLVAKPGFQSWAARFPLTRRIARKEGEALFDLVSGFVQSQALWALVELDVLRDLAQHPQSAANLGLKHGIASERMTLLLRAGAAMGLMREGSAGFHITRKGSALLGVPGLEAMIRHHDVLYRDLADPIAVLKGEKKTELAEFWPYVFGGAMPAEQAEVYSDLMADSQKLVIEDTLHAVSFKGVKRLMDVGGGSGAFLSAVLKSTKPLEGIVFDLPEVVPHSLARFDQEGLASRAEVRAGSFKTDALPQGADMISLVRVLYDHSDETVADLLAKAYAALPEGGRILVSEPMLGDSKPHRPGDVYFAFYCMAMRTGRARQPAQIAEMLKNAGFGEVNCPVVARPFVTSVVLGQKI